MALGFYLDMTKCIGCKACQVQCKDKNRLGIGPIIRKVTSYCTGSFPDAFMFHVSQSCGHCDNPACVAACATGAMYKAEDGTVLHDAELCIGCQNCVAACPYGHPQYIEELQKVVKCDSCYAIRQAGGIPACVAACPMRALDFGEMDELKAKYGSDLVSDIPVMPNSSATGANFLMKIKEAAKSTDAKEIWL